MTMKKFTKQFCYGINNSEAVDGDEDSAPDDFLRMDMDYEGGVNFKIETTEKGAEIAIKTPGLSGRIKVNQKWSPNDLALVIHLYTHLTNVGDALENRIEFQRLLEDYRKLRGY